MERKLRWLQSFAAKQPSKARLDSTFLSDYSIEPKVACDEVALRSVESDHTFSLSPSYLALFDIARLLLKQV